MQQSTQPGFTLIEVLIVLVIIAIMSAVVVLNVNTSNYSGFIAEANKIASTLEIIADEAVYTNSVIACDVKANGFSCQSYKNGDWQVLNMSKLVSWQWPRGITIETVYLNGNPLKSGDQLRFFANGDLPPMSLQVTDGIHHAWIDGDLSGDFKVSN
jgi:type II secretion system protein H